MRINRLKAVQWDVEEHLEEREGVVSKGPLTSTYHTEPKAIQVMALCRAHGNGCTCIVRNRRGEGRMVVLGLV